MLVVISTRGAYGMRFSVIEQAVGDTRLVVGQYELSVAELVIELRRVPRNSAVGKKV